MTGIADSLRAELGDAVRSDAETLAAHRRDTWVLSELADLEQRPGPDPLLDSMRQPPMCPLLRSAPACASWLAWSFTPKAICKSP